MVLKMGRHKCPYCSKIIPVAKTIKAPPPPIINQVLIILEHGIYALVLLFFFCFSAHQRGLWQMNRDFFNRRMQNKSNDQISLNSFRRKAFDSLISLLIALCMAVLKLQAKSWGQTDFLEMATSCLLLLHSIQD
jgi:hypothetical protein